MRFLLLLLPLAWLASCQSESKPAGPVAVRDGLGRALTLPAHPRRVLALAPSMTEMLYAVADTATVVARCPQDNYPAAVLQKPVVNNYPLDLERLVTLRPEVVFTVEGITSVDDAKRLQELGIPVYYMRFRKVEDVFKGLEELGRLLGRPAQGHRVADSLRQELKRVVAVTPGSTSRPKVLAITWQDPIYCYGQNTLFTDEIRLAGGQNAVTETFPQPYPALTREYILKLNPDVLLGGRFWQLDSTFFGRYPELRRMEAYRTRRVFPITGNLMERPGPRVVQSVRELQTLLQTPPALSSIQGPR
ncbi:helical backbone metal receptor [Hymenobacter sp. 5317J-9]|uniref:ABC transporter substrate-binding protein n=1 Tax=Hymenobacter sp. 5317J-9 TaxID=2932250 RepID=UPI001FD6969D|nr:helical backbone metal receptor [Hymenobacter sp. 5317J-9]UOQ99418.1 helical backbone metal receptor [Hymenobacter sp. 5317J-9]